MEKILVSACLLGINCKYNGGNNYNEKIIEYLKDKEVIPICPEIYGGLSTPRKPSERKGNLVIDNEQNDVTLNFKKGAEETLKLAKLLGVKKALLKSKSPSCGYKMIYDGTFTDHLIAGNGVTTELLLNEGIEVLTEKDF